MDIVLMISKIPMITNPVIRESALPDLSGPTKDRSASVRVSALNQLNGMFQGYVGCRCQENMNVLGHHNELVNSKSTFAAIAIDSLQEKANVIIDNEQSSALPGGKRYEVSSGRRDQSSGLPERTSAAKAAIFAKPKSARVELVPFPVFFVFGCFILEHLNG